MVATHNRAGSVPQAYSNLPASPTLTNPDMILPDYELSPGLDDHDLHDQSTLMMWKNAQASASSVDLQELFSSGPLSGNMSGSLSNSLSVQDHGYSSGPITPTTPIIYGNGTMLSDIGEVTEVESTVGRSSPTYGRRIGGYNNGLGNGTNSRSPSPVRHQYHHTSSHHGRTGGRDSSGSTPRRLSPANVPDNELGGGSSGGERGDERTMGVKERARQQQDRSKMRRDSIESNSTITTEDRAGVFANFDDTMSVGDDSVFQGDDEESVAESYADEPYMARHVPMTRAAAASAASAAAASGPAPNSDPDLLAIPSDFGGGGSGSASDDGDRRLSAASLSIRAEQILANAKKRLTTMEGNLHRARSSLYISPPSLGSLPSDGSASPRTPIRAATASSRYHDPAPVSPVRSHFVNDGSSAPVSDVAGGINGVSGSSDNNASSTAFPQRSASALGAAGGYRQPTPRSSDRSSDQQRLEAMHDSLTGGYRGAGLNRQDGAHGMSNGAQYTIPNVEGIVSPVVRSSSQQDAYLSPTYSSYSNGGTSNGSLSRSGSVVQMRDLKDQVKDLKGKISSLREQARADSLKRLSIQSQRTPSPFTYSQVGQWYAEPLQPQQKSSPLASPSVEDGLVALSAQQQQQQQQQQQPRYNNGNGRDTVTPPAQVTECQGGAPLYPENDRGSRHSGDSQRTVSTQLAAADRADQDMFTDTYGEPQRADDDSDDSEYNGNRMAKRSADLVHAAPSSESLVLGGAAAYKPTDDYDAEDGGDSSDDMRTENGDFADAIEDNNQPDYGLQKQQQQQQRNSVVNEVFVDAIDVDEVYVPSEDDDDDEHFTDAEYVDYGSDGYGSEAESLYHDTLQHPISHEDREDAFDYEHFILHSALGTISQQRLARGRGDSFSSDDSAETTRGPVPSSSAAAAAAAAATQSSVFDGKSPSRRTSLASIATVESVDSVESFATATEGRSSRVSRMSRHSRVNLTGARENGFEDLAEDSYEERDDDYQTYSNRNSVIASRNQNHPPLPGTAAAPAVKSSSGVVAAAKDRPDSVALAHAAAAAANANANANANGTASSASGNSASHHHRGAFSLSDPDPECTEDLRQAKKPYMARRPVSSTAMHSHRSASSFESTGTTRSFPLVNRNRVGSLNAIGGTAGYPGYRAASSNNGSSSPGSAGPTPTPSQQGHRAALTSLESSSSSASVSKTNVADADTDAELRSISASLLNDTASICDQQQQQQQQAGTGDSSQSQALQALAKDDQLLVERLVANLGRCVLGLSESGRASSESRAYRRRIDAARRILEGLDAA